jgi:hypothetical protein
MTKKYVIICVIFLTTLFLPGKVVFSRPIEPVQPLMSQEKAAINPANANEIAEALDIILGDLVSASIGSSDAQGTGVADTALSFFPVQGDSFVILSTGLATSADDPDTNNEETFGEGGFMDDVSTELTGLNNSQGNDLVQLTLVLTPPPDKISLSFDFAFYSEEFPDWVNSHFNDVFVAELGAEPFSSDIQIDGINVTVPANIAFDPNGDLISVNAAFGFDPANPNPDTDTTYDGTSGLLRATGCLPAELPTGNVTLILSITDLGDAILDSAVFLDNFQWGNPEECGSGTDPLFGSISITKEAPGAGGEDTFIFAGTLPGFTLAHSQTITVENLAAGEYSLIETSVPGPLWALLTVQCAGQFLPIQDFTNPAGRGVVLELLPAQNLACVFHNEKVNLHEGEEGLRLYLPLIIK